MDKSKIIFRDVDFCKHFETWFEVQCHVGKDFITKHFKKADVGLAQELADSYSGTITQITVLVDSDNFYELRPLPIAPDDMEEIRRLIEQAKPEQ